MTNLWRPERSQLDRNSRALLSMVPGSLQGLVAQASPVKQRVVFGEDVDPNVEEWLSFAGKRDTFTISTPGQQELVLSYRPMEDTEHVRWHPNNGAGVIQNREEYDIVGSLLTLKDPLSVMKVGDKITVQYLHTFNEAPPEPTALTSVPLGGTWKYKLTINGRLTGTSYAQTGFDDTSWPEGVTPFTGNINDSVWMRRWVTMHGGTRLKIFADYIDDRANIFLNGTQILNWSWNGYGANHTYYTAELPPGEHLVAVDGYNLGSGGMGMPVELYEEVMP